MALASCLLWLTTGAALLIWGAETFMSRLGEVAKLWRLPAVAVAVLLAGAEPEELITAVTANIQGHPTLAVTDALGANITMATLGLGLAVLVAPLRFDHLLRHYALLSAGCGALAGAVLWNSQLGRAEAAALIAAYIAVVAGMWRWQRTPPLFGELAEADDDERAYDTPDEDTPTATSPPKGESRAMVFLVTGLAAMLVGGWCAVRGADQLARWSGLLSEKSTGLTVLAFATSIEVFALVWAAKRHALTTVAIGGVLGSLIYNFTMTLGASAMVSPLEFPDLRLIAFMGAMIPLLLLAVAFLSRSWRIPRGVGIVLALSYLGYVALALGGS